MLPVKYNKKFLEDTTKMDTDSLQYFVEASAFLYEYLHKEGLDESFHTLVLHEWLTFYDAGGFKQITPESFATLLDILAEKFPQFSTSTTTNPLIEALKNLSCGRAINFQITKYDMLTSLISGRKMIDWSDNDIYKAAVGLLGFIYGPIGAFIYMNRMNTEPQFKKEFIRLLSPNDSITSNSHLFFMAYWFAKNGYKVGFVSEGKGKTPDLVATIDTTTIYIEANAKRSDTSSLNRMIEEAIVEKKQKFNSVYKPGVIAVDIGSKDLNEIKRISVERGKFTEDKLERNVMIYDDKNFASDPSNASLVETIASFKSMDPNFVPYLLVTQSNLLKFNLEQIENPIDVILIADKHAVRLSGIAKTNYWV
jgi:hypothetical protein